MHVRPWVGPMLRFDAALNAVGVVVAAIFAGQLAEVLGLSARWPLYAVGALLAVNAAELLLTAKNPTRGMLTALAAADIVFIVGVVAFAATGDGIETWARWALFAIAAATVGTAEAKLIARRPAARPAHG